MFAGLLCLMVQSGNGDGMDGGVGQANLGGKMSTL